MSITGRFLPLGADFERWTQRRWKRSVGKSTETKLGALIRGSFTWDKQVQVVIEILDEEKRLFQRFIQ